MKKVRNKEDISIERAHRTKNIPRNNGTRNKKKIIVVKFLNFKKKSKEKIFVYEDFGGDSQH